MTNRAFRVRALLDVNALIALVDITHEFHRTVVHWLERNATADGRASCPITQNGAIRILSQPAYQRGSGVLRQADAALRHVATFLDSDAHQHWPADISIADPNLFNHSNIQGHRQVTDAYLLGLAVKHGGRLVTFDQAVPLAAVHGAKARHLVVI